MYYYAPATGAITEYTQALTISVAIKNLEGLSNDFAGRDYVLNMTGPSRYLMTQLQNGVIDNLLYGGYRRPHGALEGQTRLAAATVADTSTTINCAEDTDEHGNPLFETGRFFLIASDLPKSMKEIHQDNVTLDIVEIGAYTYGVTNKNAIPIIGVGTALAIGKTFVTGAFVQPIKAFPSSLGPDASNGLLAQLSKPTTPTGLAATTSTTAQIDSVAWAESAELRDDAGGGTIGGYDIYVLKTGQGICANGAPTAADFKRNEWFVASVVDQNPTPAASVQTVTNLTQYFDQTTGVLTTITTGIFYVVLVAKTASDIGDRIYYSEPAIDEVDVPV